MGKQKVVLKLTMEDAKKRSKALQTVVGLSGVISATLELEKGQIVVVGDGIDAATLTNMLRKRMGYVEIVSVAAVEEKKEKDQASEEKNIQPIVWPYHYSVPPPPTYYEIPQQSVDPCCIM